MVSDMKINALAPWFGSKRTTASRIIAEFGQHTCYWEPLCGSCAVLLAKKPSAAETVNDLHGGLTCLARTLANHQEAHKLYWHLSRVLPCEQVWRDACGYIDRITPEDIAPDAEWSARYLLASWLARNGMGGTDSATSSFAARFSATGGTTATRWRNVVESIPAWHDRLRNVTILNRDCFDVLARIDDAKGTVIYLDPPYVQEGNRYDHKFTREDHFKMYTELTRFRSARVVISYYDDPLVEKLYKGWTRLEISTPKFLANAGQRESDGTCPTAPEILLINGPSLTTEPDLFGGD